MKLSPFQPEGRPPRWMVDYGRIGGKRKREFFDDEEKARKALSHAQREAKKHGTSAVGLQLSDRVRFADAEKRLALVGATLQQAVDFYILHAAAIRKPVTVEELGKQCIAAKEAQGRREHYTRMLHVPIGKLPQAMLAHEVTSEHVKALLAGQKIKPKTRNNWLGYISAIWKWGKDNGMVSIDPSDGVERYDDDRDEIDLLSVPECRTLLDHIRANLPKWLPFHVLGIFAGIRPDEIRRMTWGDINIEEGTAVVRGRSSKTRQRRIVTLEPAAGAWLALCDPTKPLTPKRSESQLAGARKIIGRPWVHDGMRHSFGSYHLAHFKDEKRTQLEMGHGSSAMLWNHYRALVTEKDAAAFWQLMP